MTQTMLSAQVVEKKKPYELREVEIPKPKGHELLLKIKVAGYCHTDAMVQEGGIDFAGELPLIGSHEPAGIVEAVGDQVKGFKKGDRVGSLTFKDTCGECTLCKGSDTRPADARYCKTKNYVGIVHDGAFAGYTLVDSRWAAIIPESLPFDQAAPMTCAGATIWSAILACDLKKGQSIAIVGLGALGHIGTQLAKALGYKVVGIDARDEPLQVVKKAKHAPDLAINAKEGKDKILQQIKEKLGESEGVDAVIDATGVNEGHELCLQILKIHGTFMLVGQPPEPIKVNFYDLIFRGIVMKGSLLATQKQFADLLKFSGENDIRVDVRPYKLRDVNKMVEDAHKSDVTGKAIVVMDD